MKEMKERILQYLQEHPKGNKKEKDMIEDLGIEDTEMFYRALEEMRDAWEIVREKEGNYRTALQAGISEGILSIARNGMGYVDRDKYESIRVAEQDQLDAMDGDTVIVRCLPWQMYGEILEVKKRKRDHLIATYVHNGRKLVLIPDDAMLRRKMIKVLADQSISPVDGLKVVCAIEKYGKPLTLRVVKEIGHKDDPGVDILSVLLDHDINPEFPEEAMAQAKAVPSSVKESDLKGRKDLRQERTVTIDGDDSKDFDDAVSIETNEHGWYLKVSIADVSHYVTEGSPLDKEAYRRGCSTYAVNTVVPMLPHILSNGICSLNPKEDRLTITCAMQVEKNGMISDYDIYPSVICSDERMTYKNVNRILDGDSELCEKYSHLGDMFTELAACADAIRSARMNKGAIEFASEESEIRTDETGKPVYIGVKERGHAERMIEDCMIAANVSVANFLKWQSIPAIYRIHEEPKARRVSDFVRASEAMGHKFVTGKNQIYPNEIQRYLDSVSDTEEYPVLSRMLLRCMQKAKYDASCAGHFGLAEEEYLHFTSPIRRYPDLVVHRMLRRYSFELCMDEKQRLNDESFVQDAAEMSSVRERISQDAEYECADMKKAEYMEEHLNETFHGIISGVTSHGIYVELPNTIEGLVRISSMTDDYYEFDKDRMQLRGEFSGRVYRLGMKVKVTVAAASRTEKTVDFLLSGKNGRIERKSTGTHRHGRK